MTADEWDRCLRSDWMVVPLGHWLLANPASAGRYDRKLRLYAVACCRQLPELFELDLFRRAVDAAERLADGRADGRDLKALYDEIMAYPTPNAQSHLIENVALKLIGEKGVQCALSSTVDLGFASGGHFDSVVRDQAPLLRCVCGNPFRPVAFDPRWRTSFVFEVARSIDADRAFGRMPELADALEDAACDHPEVLAHCRGGGPHVRGCWVIDEVLAEGEVRR